MKVIYKPVIFFLAVTNSNIIPDIIRRMIIKTYMFVDF